MQSHENPDNAIMDPFVDANWVVARSILARLGFEPPPPEALDDMQLRGRLWELIYAMAARRFYLSCTDHLSDRELHRWLHKRWLPEAAADMPPEAEWNARISPVCDGDDMENTTTWLRYYADEDERRQFSPDEIPAHEDPKHDRDRFLPDAPLPRAAICDEDFTEECDDMPFGGADEEDDDPLGLNAVDEAIRADREESDTGAMAFDDDGEPIEEDWQQPLAVLRRQGVPLLPPDEHTDETIGAGLWELLHELACQGFYVLHTDHLTDRQLYAALWKDSLREPAMLPGRCLTAAWYHDFTGSGSEADELLHLRYYATDVEWAEARRDRPEMKLPAREQLVANRDWRLPKGPF